MSDFHHTLHHELPISKKQFFAAVGEATRHWGAPVSEPAAIPTLLLSQFAKHYVTVVLTGEGADELFVGYPKYQLENWFGKLPLLQHLPSWLIPARSRRFGRLRDALQASRVQDRNVTWFGAFSEAAISRLLGAAPGPGLGVGPCTGTGSDPSTGPSIGVHGGFAYKLGGRAEGSLSSLLKFDRETWLTHNLLHKFDAMTMAGSLEARVPFLDSQVVQAALDIPVQWHLRHGPKSVLKEAFTDLVPRGYFASPKNGFRVPVAKWLGELNLEGVLGRGTLVADGVLRQDEVDRFVAAFRKHPAYHDRRLWTLWALEVWYQMTFATSENPCRLFENPLRSLSSVGGAG